MKKFLLFLLWLFMLLALIYVSATIYVCDYNSTIRLKSVGIDYTCKCTHTNNLTKTICEKN